jgi:hypothetical protein
MIGDPNDHLYVLGADGRTPEKFEGTMPEWAVRVFGPTKTLARDELPCGGFVSTIFLGIDVSFGTAPQPILFETAAFDHLDGMAFQHREWSYGRAMKTHAQVVAHVMAGASE